LVIQGHATTRAVARAAFALLWLLCWAPAISHADETPRDVGHLKIDVTADRVEYFADEGIVLARGHVVASLPDGTSARADAFAMDLRQHRLVIAGHVDFLTSAGEFHGAAISDFLAFGRVYFLPLDPTADRWTFFNGDYAKPARGRDMPGDVFYLPDLRGHRPYITGGHATIDAGTYVKMEPATTAVLMGPDTPPLPAFVDNFSSNPAFGQNALAGATFDAPYPFYGSGNTLDTLHFRYDQALADPYFLSYEHHSVADDGAYAVFSLNPMTQSDKQWTLLGYLPMGTKQAVSVDSQLFTSQSGLAQPQTSNGFADVRYLTALRQSSILADATQVYDSLIPGVEQQDHPFVFGLEWTGYQQTIFHSGFTFRALSGLGWIHDAYGVGGFGSRDVRTSYYGATVGTPTVDGPFGSDLYATGSMEATDLSFPNRVVSQTATVSDGKQLAARLYGVISGSVGTVDADNPLQAFASPNSAIGLAPSPLSPNGLPVLEYPTETAGAVDREYEETLSWQPSAQFQFSAIGLRSVYVPDQPIAPSVLALSVRADVTRSLYVTLGRAYQFNWRGQGWGSQFSIQVTGQ
jgi:hypothetical protein